MADLETDYLIVGNSAAGISAAESIQETLPDSSILIVGDEPYAAYGRPLISYMIEGKTTEDDIYLRDDDFYERNGFSTLLGPDFKAVSLDSSAHLVTLADGQKISYGKCLIATGSVPFTPPIEGLSDANNVYNFMNLDDAKSLWSAARDLESKEEGDRPSRIIVVGAGLIGLKAAEAIAGYADEVVVLELAPRILPAVLDAEGAAVLQTILDKHGITCMPGVSAERFEQEDGKITRAVLTNGESLDCDIVVAAVGVRPNVSLAQEAGADVGRGLLCDVHLMTTLDDVYAAGDVVQVKDLLDGSEHPLALWPNAIKQGRLAGHFMADPDFGESYQGGFAVNAVDFFDASLLTSGTINPPEDKLAEGVYSQDLYTDGDTYAKFVKRDGKLVGYILLNRPTNAGIYTSLIENETPLDGISEAIFEKPPENIDLPAEQRWTRLHRGYPESMDRSGLKRGRA